jgi:hypothetical protein
MTFDITIVPFAGVAPDELDSLVHDLAVRLADTDRKGPAPCPRCRARGLLSA